MKVLRTLRKNIKLSQQQVADKLGVSRSLVSIWESDANTTEPGPEYLPKLAALYGVSIDYLLKGSESPSIHRFPIVGDVSAGFKGPEAQETYTGDTIDIPLDWLHGLPPTEYFVIRASGDSMWPDIRNGDLLLVQRMTTVPSGETAIVIFGDGVGSVKKLEYSMGGGIIDLIPRNPEYKPLQIVGEDVNRVYVQGMVTMVIRRLS